MYSIDPTFYAIQNDPHTLIQKAEKRYQNRIDELIANIPPSTRFLALAGPSCCGKTTTAHRLINAFESVGRKVYVLSIDDFFQGVENAPLDDEGKPDLDHIDLIDRPELKKVIDGFCRKEVVHIPTFNFIKRAREEKRQVIDTKEYDLCIVEGLHALHPHFNGLIPQESLFSLYVTVADAYYLGDKPFLSIRETRLLRRMIRDYYCRGASLPYTYQLWRNVIKGEKRFIYPSIIQADWLISSCFITEPHLLAHDALPLLSKVEKEEALYPLAQVLSQKLQSIPPLSPALLPKDSLLREFVGHR